MRELVVADPELIEALVVNSDPVTGKPVAQLRPAPDVALLQDMPTSDARDLASRSMDWETVYFRAALDSTPAHTLQSDLVIGKPFFEVKRSDIFNSLPEPLQGTVEAQLDAVLSGDDTEHKVSSNSLPFLLARIAGKGNITLVVCTGGTNANDYWREDPATPESNHEIDLDEGLITSEERAALEGLYAALNDAGWEMLAGAHTS
jgi:hypothetical protein